MRAREALNKTDVLAVVNSPKKIAYTFIWSVIGAVFFLGTLNGLMSAHPSIIVNRTDDTEIAVEVMSAMGSMWTDPFNIVVLGASMFVTVCIRAKLRKSK